MSCLYLKVIHCNCIVKQNIAGFSFVVEDKEAEKGFGSTPLSKLFHTSNFSNPLFLELDEVEVVVVVVHFYGWLNCLLFYSLLFIITIKIGPGTHIFSD